MWTGELLSVSSPTILAGVLFLMDSLEMIVEHDIQQSLMLLRCSLVRSGLECNILARAAFPFHWDSVSALRYFQTRRFHALSFP